MQQLRHCSCWQCAAAEKHLWFESHCWVAMVRHYILVQLSLDFLVHSRHSKQMYWINHLNLLVRIFFLLIIILVKSEFKVKQRLLNLCLTSNAWCGKKWILRWGKCSIWLPGVWNLALQVNESLNFQGSLRQQQSSENIARTNWGTIRREVRWENKRELNVFAMFVFDENQLHPTLLLNIYD